MLAARQFMGENSVVRGAAWILLLVSWGATGQDGGVPPLTIDQVIQRMSEMDRSRVAELQSYTVTRRYSLENRRFNKRVEMTVRMSYTAPGKKEFEVLSEKGSGAIRKRVFHKMIEAEMEAAQEEMRGQAQITPENYEFRLVGTEARVGRGSYLIEVKPRINNKFLLKGRIWVDAQDFAIVRIEGSPAQNPSFWTRKVSFVHRYAKFAPFWLAVSNRSEAEVLIFGSTEVLIEYFDYQIHRGPAAGISRSNRFSWQVAPAPPCCGDGVFP